MYENADTVEEIEHWLRLDNEGLDEDRHHYEGLVDRED